MQIKVHNPNNLPLINYKDVKPLQGNLKDLNEENYNKLKSVLTNRGFDVPLFVWKNGDDYFLMDGHQRQRVMIKEQAEPHEVPYILIEADDEKEAKAKLLEITSQYGTITQEGFDEFIADLPEAEILEAVHFDALNWKDPEPEVEEDEPPAVDESEPPKSKLGEIYQLGRHRVMCGDSTDKAQVERLMGGVKADMVFTDPPYGMNLEADWSSLKGSKNAQMEGKRGGNKYNKVIGDDKDYDPSPIFEMFDYCKEIFLWGADYYHHRLPIEGCFLVWDKRLTEQADEAIGSSFEIIWSRQKHKKYIVRYFSSGAFGTRPLDKNREHPTQKPVGVCQWFTDKYSENGAVIVDLFLGSGSTLIACEQTDRTCYGMELDPKYVDVIRKRYWKFVNGDEDGWENGTPAIERELSEVKNG